MAHQKERKSFAGHTAEDDHLIASDIHSGMVEPRSGFYIGSLVPTFSYGCRNPTHPQTC